MFGLYNVPLKLSYTPDQSATVENVKFLAGNTVYAWTTSSSSPAPQPSSCNTTAAAGFSCPFVNIQLKEGGVTSLLLENPVGCPLADLSVGLRSLNISKVYKDERLCSPVAVADLARSAGQTLYA